MTEMPAMPSIEDLLNPTLRALHDLGGSASIQELAEEVLKDLQLPPEVAEQPHGERSETEVEYRAAWARTYLKKAGLVTNSSRGVWALTAAGKGTSRVDPRTVMRKVNELKKSGGDADDVDSPQESGWKDELTETLLAMDPSAFERLCQRVLRESGFIEVDVTRRSGDGGIDGYGTIRVAGLISFNVLFQAKRYRRNIGPEVVRDFRGAMVGRADKGLIITTGGFTREARREAIRDGAPPIDLMDGDLLSEKLKELSLGVTTHIVEQVDVEHEWFDSI
jgi:restriction system protein